MLVSLLRHHLQEERVKGSGPFDSFPKECTDWEELTTKANRRRLFGIPQVCRLCRAPARRSFHVCNRKECIPCTPES